MKHFVRIHYNVPELGGELLNIAELEEISAHECTMVRMIELDPAETITGIYVDGRVIGQANQPMGTVPHPRTYDSMEGITATHLSEEDVEQLGRELDAIREQTSKIEDWLDSLSEPVKPYLPAIGRFLIVVTFLEDALRILTQWTDQLVYLHDYRHSKLLFCLFL